MRHEGRVLLLALLAPLPSVLVALILLLTTGQSAKVQSTLGVGLVGAWLLGAFALRGQVVRALQGLANLLGALREGDFSVRGRHADPRDALGEVLVEVNSLADTLARQRTGAAEATALLSKVMAEVDVAIFAFDGASILRLCNRAGERLVAAARLGSSAAELGLAPLLQGIAPRTVTLPGGEGQWELRRNDFRLGGLPHHLLVLTDLRRALREEERQAWQRLVRVLGHEINNSLAPIRSIAGDLQNTLGAASRAPDWQEDLGRGLGIIERRAEALGRFMASYARLLRLPPPTFAPVDLGACLRRVVALETRLPVRLEAGPAVTILGDADQLEQLLINLVGNGVEAALETGGGVSLSWRTLGGQVEVLVTDEGPGIADTHNLFVPFFTTKPTGSGIGLVLSRQIAEAHRGALNLEARAEGRGAVARLRLPR
jgi:nitrogen fixation/metabolism regulation signal transduction histidine kinase